MSDLAFARAHAEAAIRALQDFLDATAGRPAAPAPVALPKPAATEPTLRPIAWGAKVSPLFRKRVLWIESDLGINADNLMACMAFETGRRFTADVKNPKSTATGLIQFMAATAKTLGTTTAELARMTAEDQLNYVWKYMNQPHLRGRIKTLADCYLAILWPAGVGEPDDYVLFDKRNGAAYRVNAGLDANKDGRVTKREASAKVAALLVEGRKPENIA